MSMNRRRWSNKFIESMREFLNKEKAETEAEISDSLEKATMSTTSSNDTHYTDVTSTLHSPNNMMSLKSQSSSGRDSEFSLAFDNFNDDLNKTKSLSNVDSLEDQCVESNLDYLNTTVTSNTLNLQSNAIEVLDKNISCKEPQNDLIQFDDFLNLNIQNTEVKSVQCKFNENSKQNDQTINYQKYFSSPEFQINQIDQPDVWDALIALENELSPFDEREKTIHEQEQNFPQILNRLSQKFKETPTKFTEKLVSIIEDSIVSLESPNKQNAANASGVSLSRMTGEFRKLCKFIDDESMPEWAPSLMNATSASYVEKNKTLNSEKHGQKVDQSALKSTLNNISSVDTPSQRINCKLLDNLVTPKSKSNVNSPLKRFTPSADKSFEYWEEVCNMMCKSHSGNKKKFRRSISFHESTKRSLNEMLTICERQMASLDDSTIEVRNSDPCKQADRELKVTQTPRSKSESRIHMNLSIEKRQSPYTKFCESAGKNSSNKRNEDDRNDRTLENSFKENVEPAEKIEKNFEKFFSSNKSRSDNENDTVDNSDFDDDFDVDDDQDCSLLIELAKRRQRCLDTAKLMLEIDQEDPNTSSDNKCLETLYKLGVQDKTFIEDKDDAKFLNTLGHCLEYKKYFHDKSKPLINMLQNITSPDNLKNIANSAVMSKKLANKPAPALSVSSRQPLSAKAKTTLNSASKNRLTSSNNGKAIVSKQAMKSQSKVPQKLENKSFRLRATPSTDRKISSSSNSQQAKSMTGRQSAQRITPTHQKPTQQTTRRNILQVSSIKADKKTTVAKSMENLTPNLPARKTATVVRSSEKQKKTPEALKTTKSTKNSVYKDIVSPDRCDSSELPKPQVQECVIAEKSPKSRFFFTPGKNPATSAVGRKKPASYFSDLVKKPVTLNSGFEGIKSPINMYIHGVDNDLIQNVKGRTEDFLLTPISNQENGKSPRLKMKLSPSKENKSPFTNCNENKISTVRYQSADKVHLIDDKLSYSPCSLTPNSRTKKLLEPIENTVVIRHEGRVIEYNPQSDQFNSETSIRVQKMAEKTSMQHKCT